MSNSTEYCITINGRNVFFSTPGNPSPNHKEVVSDVVSGPPLKKIRSLNAYVINTVENEKMSAKITITQEEGSVDYYTTHVEEVFSETSKSYST